MYFSVKQSRMNSLFIWFVWLTFLKVEVGVLNQRIVKTLGICDLPVGISWVFLKYIVYSVNALLCNNSYRAVCVDKIK